MTGIAARRTNHPYYLTDIKRIPESLLNLIGSHLPSGETASGAFVIPPETNTLGFFPQCNPLQALIFTPGGILHVAEPEKGKKEGHAAWILTENIQKIKLSLILLYGKLEIWTDQNGQLIHTEVEYNVTSHRFLSPRLKEILRKTWGKNPPRDRPLLEDPAFPHFLFTNYSFYNGMRHEAIQPGESVLKFVYQPEIREKWLKFYQRKIFPRTMLAVTNHQLILLQEDLRYRTHHEWIFTFIPRYRIINLDDETTKECHKITIHLAPENQDQNITILLEPSNFQEWLIIKNELKPQG